MKLTPGQRAAADECSRHVLVVACPGSGKTRTIIARLVRAIHRVRGTPRRVACITYTNAAVSEIEGRLRSIASAEDSDYCDIGTIHSFCLRCVLRLYSSRLPGYESGFAIAPPDSDAFQQAGADAIATAGIGGVRPQDFESVRRGVAGQPLIPSNVGLTDECVLAFWELLRSQGFIDYPSITYLTFLLLDRFPDIAKTVSARYREVLIDEMQDTDSLQVELLRRLADAGRSRFFMVGDPMQSIFGFAGAEPARMFELAEHLDARTDFELLENWRSSSRIVRFADALCPRDEAMRAVGPDRDYRAAPVIVSPASAVDAVVGGFLPMLVREGIDVARAAVLAPAWYLLVPIAQELRRLDVPVSGPGSRPYHRRGRLMTGLLENLCACMGSTRPDLLRRVQYEIFDVCQCAEGEARFEAWGRAGRLAALQMIFRGRELRQSHVSAIPWIEAAASAFAEILRTHGFVGARGVERIVEAGAAITADIRTNRNIDPERLVVDDLGMFANPDGSMKLLTFHAAKGREFDAVCVVELQEGQMPHPSGNIEESRRVLYVAVTRPHRVLMLSHRRNARRCRFLDEPNVLSAMA